MGLSLAKLTVIVAILEGQFQEKVAVGTFVLLEAPATQTPIRSQYQGPEKEVKLSPHSSQEG